MEEEEEDAAMASSSQPAGAHHMESKLHEKHPEYNRYKHEMII